LESLTLAVAAAHLGASRCAVSGQSPGGEQVDGLVEEYGEVALTHFARQVASLDPSRRRALQRLARKS
jgi:hypothetical protein